MQHANKIIKLAKIIISNFLRIIWGWGKRKIICSQILLCNSFGLTNLAQEQILKCVGFLGMASMRKHAKHNHNSNQHFEHIIYQRGEADNVIILSVILYVALRAECDPPIRGTEIPPDFCNKRVSFVDERRHWMGTITFGSYVCNTD